MERKWGGNEGRRVSRRRDKEGERETEKETEMGKREKRGEKDKKTSTQEGQVHSNVDSLTGLHFNERKKELVPCSIYIN